ncbi:MAG TPA: DNA polymerase III subunit delta', partial [Firmicutes bacterium]|nr:DNA polymerase III subunit delta' [Bacillota bacterium]
MAFRNLVGQPGLRKALLTELRSGTVSQATLLAGPEGGGKQSWGIALARALLCPSGQGEPCGSCLSCRQLASGNHPNFFLLEPSGRWLKLEQIREVKPKFYLVSPGYERRVCLICEADRMTSEAGSSLLKLMEEPPVNFFIILTSSHPEKLLPTVVSRCRRYVLKLLTAAEVISLLKNIPGLSEAKLDLIARLSRGLPGQALALAQDPALAERVKLA